MYESLRRYFETTNTRDDETNLSPQNGVLAVVVIAGDDDDLVEKHKRGSFLSQKELVPYFLQLVSESDVCIKRKERIRIM